MTVLPADRTVSSARLADLLEGWRGEGPAYSALAGGLRAAVLAGALPTRTRLPSERDLAAALGLSRTTVSATYDLLRTEGFLISRQGSGTITALPAGASRSPRFTDLPDAHLLDLTKAAPSAPPELANACALAVDDLRHHLGGHGLEPLGLPVLRAAVAQWYIERGIPTDPEQILITTGAQQAINLLINLAARRGDRVVVEHPTYPNAIDVVTAAGARPVPVPVGEHGVDVDLLLATVRASDPRVVYLVPDHHNPTGSVLAEQHRDRLRHGVTASGALLVVDEVFADLTLGAQLPPSLLGDGTGSQVAGIGSASKSFWSGLRVGWVRASREVIARLTTQRARADISSSVLDQLVVARLMQVRTGLLARRREELRDRRDRLVAQLGELLPDWTTPVPAGGLSLWIDLGAPVSSALARTGRAHGVHLVPGTAFGVDGSFDDRLRLTFAEPEEVLDEAVRRIAAAWSALERSGAARPGAGWSGPERSGPERSGTGRTGSRTTLR
ncbi:MAG: PLP-dependent aminotransferase family protein [Cellulomonas sp.]|nr:PLP-dependent aminotransferase family protein [Cellulomonas sp.]